MSRNFELLQNLGKEELVVETVAPAEPEMQAEPLSVIEPQLKLEPMELDQLTKMVQRVFLLPGPDAARAVVFTASESGNGCSWICARVAETLAAQVSSNVYLVDANLRHPTLHQEFGVDNQEGFVDALQRGESARSFARQLSRPNLWLITAGAAPETFDSSLGSGRVRQMVTDLRASGYVLVDAPAVNASNGAASLGAVADGVVVVLRANSSRREPTRKVVQDLQAAKVNVLGAVLNQRTFPIPQSIYNRL